MKLELKREIFTETETLGSLYVDGKFFCYTCEDKPRERKKYGITAIPYGKYSVKVSWSQRFQRLQPLIYNSPDLSVTNQAGDRWEGVRFHGGNTHLNSAGCPLLGRQRFVNKPHPIHKKILNWIYGTKEKELTKLLDDNKVHELIITKS